MGAKRNQNGNEKHMAEMKTACLLKYLCTLLCLDKLQRAAEAAPHQLPGACLLSLIHSQKRPVMGKPDFSINLLPQDRKRPDAGAVSQILQQIRVKVWP